MISDTKEFIWTIRPTSTPTYLHNCSKCNKKMEFYCSEKFRLNGNHTKLAIWLIYKCIKCDTTWKHVIHKGIKPKDISTELFEKFTNNDKDTAWKYSFDLNLIQMNACVPNYSHIDYIVEGYEPEQIKTAQNESITIKLICPLKFELKLSRFLARQLQLSTRQLYGLVEDRIIQFDSALNIHKYRIRNDIELRIDCY